MKTKIGVFGSCISRDAFNSYFVPYYKDYFDVEISAQRTSMISMFQDPIYVDDDLIKITPDTKENRARTWFLKYDMTKQFTKDLIEKKIDYLIIDNYFEIRMGILNADDYIITNNNWDLPKTSFYEKINYEFIFSAYNYPVEFFQIWSEYCDLFFKFLNETCPNTRVILNKGRLIDKVIRNDGSCYVYSQFTERSKLINYFLEKLDGYIVDNFEVDVINFDFENTFLDEDHIWGLGPVHYSKEYYPKLIHSILSIVDKNKYLPSNSKIKCVNGLVDEVNDLNIKLKLLFNNFKIKKLNDELTKANRSLKSIQNKLFLQESQLLYSNNNYLENFKLLSIFQKARIDLKNFGSIYNSIEIIENSDSESIEDNPLWFKSIEGSGLIIESEIGSIDLKIKCVQEGLLKIWLRGPDIVDRNNKRFPVFIDYTHFLVNNEELLENSKLINHDNPILFEKKVAHSEIIDIHIEWRPFSNSSIYEE